jgi:eukaryotic-like serine/threonine-protein kinase
VTARTIAHYNLLDKIGEGGLGEVFRARDTRVGRTVALKLFQSATDAGACPADLLADAQAAAAISHPNIATLFDVGHADGVCYLAYEYVAGAPLRASLGGGPMNPHRAFELAVQLADALAELEANGVVHGDIRPETIAVTAKGAAKLLDSGMSRWTRGGKTRRDASDPSSLPPDAGGIVEYLSPEQAVGMEWNSRGDIFSLATVLYEMLTGRNPFASPFPMDVVANVTGQEPPPVSPTAPGVPPDADRVLAKAMAKNVAYRYETAALFASELRRVLAKLADASSVEKDNRYVLPIDDRADRLPPAVWIAILGGIALLVAIGYWALR